MIRLASASTFMQPHPIPQRVNTIAQTGLLRVEPAQQSDQAVPRLRTSRQHANMLVGEHDLHRHVEISDSQGTVASADVTISQESDRTAQASLRATAGHLTPGVRASLVHAVLDLPEVQDSARLKAAFPLLGDSETLYRLRQRCQDVRTHPAGTTALAEADLGSGLAPRLGAPASP